MKPYAGLPLALMVLAAPRLSSAQQASGFAVDTFDPSERGSDWFAADSLHLNGPTLPVFGVVGEWSHRPLVVKNADGSVRAAVLSDQFVLHPGASLLFADRFRVAFDLPLALYTHGDSVAAQNASFSAPNAVAAGDLRLSADMRILGESETPFILAVGVEGYLPTGSQSSYTSDGTVRIQPHLQLAGTVGLFSYAGKLGIEYRPDDNGFGNTQLGSTVLFNAAAGLNLLDSTLTIGPEIFGSTVFTSDEGAFRSQNTPIEALLGAHYSIHGFRFGLGGGAGLTTGLGSPAFRGLLSIEWAPVLTPADTDGDGVPDDIDACPAVAGAITTNPRTNGCPADRDGDAIPDQDDACPDVAGVSSPDPKANGCPADGDHDGVPDSADACPNVAGAATGDPKTNGCPPDQDGDGVPDKDDACPSIVGVATQDPKTNGCPPDRDGDGVPDAEDACANVAGVKTDDPKTNGCPPNPDRDGDGIPNAEDACPDAAGKPNKDPKKNGCPLAYVQGDQIRITEQVQFRTGSATLDPSGDAVLVAVAKILKDHGGLHRIWVEGHTDNAGSPVRNQKLSEGRAAAVSAWLAAHGIDKSRLSSVGYGQTKPLVSNDDDEGRRQNRRVEFRIESDQVDPTPPPSK